MPIAHPLGERLADTSVEEVVGSVRDIGRVLMALAQEHGLAHRDLKPDNLFWWRAAPALSDFGLVHVPDATSLTEPGRVPGSFGFIADEVMQGSEEIDWVLADVFSLAKVLWVLLVPSSRFPPQGALTADQGPATLARALTTPKAAELDRILEAATRYHTDRIGMEAFVAELDAWLTTPTPPPVGDNLESAISIARRSMESTLSSRDSAKRREEDARRSSLRLQQELSSIEEALRRIDPDFEAGPHAIGGLNQWIEQGEYVGGPNIESTYHYGVRIARGNSGFDLILVVAFCLQVDEDGTGYVGGLVMTGYEEVAGPGCQFHLGSRKAPIGSVQLDRHVEEIVAEAREKLPEALEAFSAGS
jgi:serine/threonine protein kinase